MKAGAGSNQEKKRRTDGWISCIYRFASYRQCQCFFYKVGGGGGALYSSTFTTTTIALELYLSYLGTYFPTTSPRYTYFRSSQVGT